jgi:hypothetical protein
MGVSALSTDLRLRLVIFDFLLVGVAATGAMALERRVEGRLFGTMSSASI